MAEAPDAPVVTIPETSYAHLLTLLDHARNWRASILPGTSTAGLRQSLDLLSAIAALDKPPCEHPRSWRIFKPESAGGGEICGYCGSSMTPDQDPGSLPSAPAT